MFILLLLFASFFLYAQFILHVFADIRTIKCYCYGYKDNHFNRNKKKNITIINFISHQIIVFLISF